MDGSTFMRVNIEAQRLREFLRLYADTKITTRELARATSMSRNTVQRLRRHLANIQFDFGDLDQLDDDQLRLRLQLASLEGRRRKPTPDWGWVHTELKDPDVTLELLWREWRAVEPNGIAYSQFTAGYRAFKSQRPLVMRQLHLPGDKLFLDFCGKTMPVYLEEESTPRMAQIFVAVLGYSNYTFACAVWTQQIVDWVQCNIDACDFLGGVPRILVPDNLKAAVITHGHHEVILNQVYLQFAQHYQTVVIPARSRRPQDKAKVEAGVKIIQRWLLAALRHQRFFSLEELNQAIARLLEQFNLR
ncbi:hypothetical protein CSQ88_21215 [Iodobacter sp. BJB302]|nr:hypothetical protein CSQ88_21215 [Iodobacter sp. BJB302]